MIVEGIKTHKITPQDKLFDVLDVHIKKMQEKSILAVTSKIVAICEGRVLNAADSDKDALIRQESELYLPRHRNKYHVSFAIKNNILIASAGIDESNGAGNYVLWPENPQKSANEIRRYLRTRFGLKECGVIITDSKTTPLRWGVTAIAIGYSGFLPLRNYINKPDIFGKKLEYTKMSIIDNLASASAMVMGEGDEQTPLAMITHIPGIEFTDADPTPEELESMRIPLEDDLYGVFINSVPWEKGGK